MPGRFVDRAMLFEAWQGGFVDRGMLFELRDRKLDPKLDPKLISFLRQFRYGCIYIYVCCLHFVV